MESFKIVGGGVCFGYVAIVLFLEWTHHMTVIEEGWPRLYKVMADRKVAVVLLFVGIGLFVEILIEKRSATNFKPETQSAAPQTPVSNRQDANNSPCANVNGNGPITINCSPGQEPNQGAKPTDNSKESTTKAP